MFIKLFSNLSELKKKKKAIDHKHLQIKYRANY